MRSKAILGILLILIGIIIPVSAVLLIQPESSSGTAIDLTFDDRWNVTPPRGDSGIFDRGDYIEIYNNQFWSAQTADLSFEPISKGSFKFKIQSLDLTKIKPFYVYLYSGSISVFQMRRSGNLMFCVKHVIPYMTLLDPLDNEWHQIEINFNMDGDNSRVIVKRDGITFVDHSFGTPYETIDKIVIYGGKYNSIPNLTFLKFESLIKYA